MEGLINVNTVKKNYFGIKDGFIIYKPSKDSEPQTFAAIEGQLVEIRTRTIKKDNREILYYDFALKCGETTNILSVPRDSVVAHSIILSLANINNFKATVRISPYKSKNNAQYTNISVYRDGEKTGWLQVSLPADKAGKLAELDKLCKAINEAIHRSLVTGDAGEGDGEPYVENDEGDDAGFDGGPDRL